MHKATISGRAENIEEAKTIIDNYLNNPEKVRF